MTHPAIRNCIHEAGHAVAAAVLNLCLCYVWVRPECIDRTYGTTHCATPHRWTREIRARGAIMVAAGDVAQRIFEPRRRPMGGLSDLVNLIDLLGVVPNGRMRRRRVIYPWKDAKVRMARREARALLRAHWPAVRTVARALRRHSRLTGAEVRGIVAGRAVPRGSR